jgi:hypothetical protein
VMETTLVSEQSAQAAMAGRYGDVVLAVYAPFGTDRELSRYPDGTSQRLIQHPLVQNLVQVADRGVGVVALIDRADDDTYLVELPAGDGDSLCVSSRWKQDMTSPRTLRGFLEHTRRAHPSARIILALEGHGAGYLPDIDTSAITPESITRNGNDKYAWTTDRHGASVEPAPEPGDAPVLPIKSPVLPIKSPVLPGNYSVMSTFGLGQALRDALSRGVGKLAAIHFNNCFNFSLELLHTIAPFADYAAGYPSYNFFTAGAAYPRVFEGLSGNGSVSALSNAELARRFSAANHTVLSAVAGHPTVGGVVRLGRVDDIVARLDDLAQSLIHALPANLDRIAASVEAALQYDTTSAGGGAGDFVLEVPDDMTDVRNFARGLMQSFSAASAVHDDASALYQALQDIKSYGDTAVPWPNPAVTWDFSGNIGINIFLPNPRRRDLWDWRTPYYLDVTQDAVQPHIIDFLKTTAWVDFILKYHADTPFKGFRAARIPEFPSFNPRAPEIIDEYRRKHPNDYPPQAA